MADIGTLLEAVKAGDVAAVSTILGSQPSLARERLSTGESPVMAALYRGHHTVVDALIAAGAPVDVFAAAALGDDEALSRSLATPSNVNAYAYDGWTPLHLAAFFGRLASARLLLDSGADLHAISSNALTNTPLHAATAGKHVEVALLLHQRGGDPLAIDAGGYTPLEIATQNGLSALVEALTRNKR
jgi:ankyrin repeat protein